jgi:hypothetical protein
MIAQEDELHYHTWKWQLYINNMSLMLMYKQQMNSFITNGHDGFAVLKRHWFK